MKTTQQIQLHRFNEISHEELVEIQGGVFQIAIAALAVAGFKLALDGSYYLGYAIGYLEGQI